MISRDYVGKSEPCSPQLQCHRISTWLHLAVILGHLCKSFYCAVWNFDFILVPVKLNCYFYIIMLLFSYCLGNNDKRKLDIVSILKVFVILFLLLYLLLFAYTFYRYYYFYRFCEVSVPRYRENSWYGSSQTFNLLFFYF